MMTSERFDELRAAADSASPLGEALDEIARLAALVYVPGSWVCPTCKFVLTKSVLYVKSGNVGVDHHHDEPCPNDGTPMDPVTWESDSRQMSELMPELAKLRAFKSYVHERLDKAGVPVDPESSHKAEGCRIGGRLDIVLARPEPWAYEQVCKANEEKRIRLASLEAENAKLWKTSDGTPIVPGLRVEHTSAGERVVSTVAARARIECVREVTIQGAGSSWQQEKRELVFVDDLVAALAPSNAAGSGASK